MATSDVYELTADDLQEVKPSVVKTGIKGADTEEKRKAIAKCLCDMIDAGIAEKGTLPNRWQRNLEYYHNEPGEKDYEVYKGATDHHQPLTQPILDTIIEDVVQPIIENDPYVYVIASGGAAKRSAALEYNLTYLMRSGGFESAAYEAARIACCTGVTPARVTFEATAQGFHSDTVAPTLVYNPSAAIIELPTGETVDLGQIVFAGINIEVVHPGDISMYPSRVVQPHRARYFGDLIPQRVQEVREWQYAGRYFNDAEIRGGMDTSKVEGQSEMLAATTSTGLEVSAIDEMVDVWRGIAKLDLDKDGIEEIYEVVVAKDQTELLDIKPFEMRTSWYVSARLRKEHNAYYPASSIADSLQRVQSYYNEMHNQLLDGAQMATGPVVFMQKGMMDSEVVNYGPREIRFVDVLPDLKVLTIDFDAGPVVAMIEQLKADAYASAGFGPNQQGQQGPNEQTATQTVTQNNFSTKRAAGYREIFAQTFVEPVAYLTLEHYRNNYDLLHAVHGDQLKPITREELNSSFRIKVAGATTNTSPVQQAEVIKTIVGNLPAFFEADPLLRSQINIGKMLESLVQSQLPNSDAFFRTPEETAIHAKLLQIMQIMQQGEQAMMAEAQDEQAEIEKETGVKPDVQAQILDAVMQVLTAPMEASADDSASGMGAATQYPVDPSVGV